MQKWLIQLIHGIEHHKYNQLEAWSIRVDNPGCECKPDTKDARLQVKSSFPREGLWIETSSLV